MRHRRALEPNTHSRPIAKTSGILAARETAAFECSGPTSRSRVPRRIPNGRYSSALPAARGSRLSRRGEFFERWLRAFRAISSRRNCSIRLQMYGSAQGKKSANGETESARRMGAIMALSEWSKEKRLTPDKRLTRRAQSAIDAPCRVDSEATPGPTAARDMAVEEIATDPMRSKRVARASGESRDCDCRRVAGARARRFYNRSPARDLIQAC